ncbi:cytokinin dehydrogenase 6-like [Curcuma longa]|uniref:cytokinin dehydrogenase 6-like n=1 Tax=Curcuma longa TaxID=136217 RepID=UPI003D9DFD77
MVARISQWLDNIPRGIASKLNFAGDSISRFAADFGSINHSAPPTAVFRPSSAEDIAALLRFAYDSDSPFPVAAWGSGASTRGQAFAPGGVVIDMAALRVGGRRISVSVDGMYVDAGGEQMWIDVLEETLRHGLSLRSCVDFLYLSVGGTLSNAGTGGTVFRHGPHVSRVLELDVITGKGEMITCSPELHSDLFYGVLGGLGQLGVITRARIGLCSAPTRVRWLRLFYTDFDSFTRDQEFLISLPHPAGFDYIEGQVLPNHQQVDDPTFYTNEDTERINQLAAEFDRMYFLEAAVFFDSTSEADQKVEGLLTQLNFNPGFAISKDVSHLEFLNRVHIEITHKQISSMTGDSNDTCFHPWLHLLVPRSRIRDIYNGVFKGILQNVNPKGLTIFYPMNKNRWNDVMTGVVPDDEVFYTVEFLWTAATVEEWKNFEARNNEILEFCDRQGIKFKKNLPHYTTQADWERHFGLAKWEKFVQLKQRYDPKAVLSPGQQIFTTVIEHQA